MGDIGDLSRRIANIVARAVVQLVDDAKKLQLLQVGVLAGETIDDAEHCQPYGFSSVPLAGAEAVVVFPNGDRSHPLAIAVSDRRYRPTGGQAGQVGLYHYLGAVLVMLANGTVEIRSAAGVAQPTIKGTSYRTAEDTLITALTTAFTALNAYAVAIKPIADPTNAATPALTAAMTTAWAAAVTAFNSAASTYLTTVAKLE